jgi:hypothetical protein
MIRCGGTLRQIARGKEEFEDFVLRTYKALLAAESFSPHSLEHIGRFDIGVMWNPTTEVLEYFVNEVERGVLVCLFGYLVDVYSTDKVGDQTAEHLIRTLDRYYKEG